ncbi:OsmC family protein [Persephonella sp.]
MEKKAVIRLEESTFTGEVNGNTINLTETGIRAVDLMLISIGYCFGLTVEAYVNHKGYKIEDLQITVKGKKHEKENRYDRITIEVSFKSDLSPEQIERIMTVGKRGCTVSNSMLKTPDIQTVYLENVTS